MTDFSEKTYSLLELCEQIQESIELSMPSEYRVTAEISSLSVKGGHCYMELVEKSQESAILSAKIRATCWSNDWKMLSSYFAFETGQMLSPGMQVLLEVSVRFHPVFGLSLQVSGIDPSYTLGDLARQRQKTIQRLQDEGVFDLQQQLSLPTLPKRIAVVSSPDAAGYGDFTHQLLSSGFSFHPVLFPAIMQGDRAAVSIIEALGKIYDESGNFDVVVIIRGGGATTDLSCFDNYELAFHITQFPLPVLSGIGHQRDVSVVDMVSYLSEKTPTAVAECLVSEMQQQQEKLTLLSNRMFASADKRISLQREKLRVVITMLRNVSFSFINRQTNRLALAQKTLLLLSPAEIYRKGYSLARVNGKTVRSIADVKPGDVITTCLADGSIESTVNDK